MPAFRTTLIGREDDLAGLAALLTDEAVRLVTLTGTGGIGKTRLAAAAAQRVADRFPDGARFVDLSGIDSAALVGEALARGLGVRTSARCRPPLTWPPGCAPSASCWSSTTSNSSPTPLR